MNIDLRRFWWASGIAFFITIWHPISILIAMPTEVAFTYIRHEPTWSFYSVFLIPIGVGLLALTIDHQVIFNVQGLKKWAYGGLYLLLSAIIIWGVSLDSKGIPTPDRISMTKVNEINFQKLAVKIDQCLITNKGCIEDLEVSKLKNDSKLKSCRDKYKEMDSTFESNDSIELENFSSRHAYICHILYKMEENDVKELPKSIVTYVAKVLNFIIAMFVWTLVLWSFFLFSNYFNSVHTRVINILSSCVVVLVLWFPFRIYANWHQWYGDFNNILYYQAFWVFGFFALLLLVIYTTWIIKRTTEYDLVQIITAFLRLH